MKKLTLDADEVEVLRAVLDLPGVDPPHFSSPEDVLGAPENVARSLAEDPLNEAWSHVDGEPDARGVTVQCIGRRNPYDEVEAPTSVVLAAIDALDIGGGPPEAPPGILISLRAKLNAATAAPLEATEESVKK